ncbi:MAG TPA: PilZ domain-containing protein [Bryobacteraceae bacterium]|nr:PilZ domain-containing protein [Bryobacteraceae bacterium]
MEQRKSQRFDLKLPLELIRGGPKPSSQHGETKNLSSSGVLFQADATLRIGESLEYFITLPTTTGPGVQVRIRCVGKVVRLAKPSGVAATLERYEFVRLRR